MDLGAYSQIQNFEQIAVSNGIEIPRLRGYRLMKDEKPVIKEEINEMKKFIVFDIVKDLCRSEPFWNPNSIMHDFSNYTDYLIDCYLIKEKDEDGVDHYVGVRWDRIHGKKRKILKILKTA